MFPGSPRFRFRPHHFLCTLGFRGKGYSTEFVAGFQHLADQLRTSPDGDQIPIEIVSTTDSICAPCPNRRDERCETEAKIQKLDEAHAQALGIRAGETLTWGEAKEKIAMRISDEDFQRICQPCSWRSLGVCQSALQELRTEKKKAEMERKSTSSGNFLKLVLSAVLLLTAADHTTSAWASPSASPSPPTSPSPSVSPTVSPSPSTSPSASPSSAAAVTVPPSAPGWPTTLKKPLVLWEDLLPKKSSKTARDLNRALEALSEKKYARTRSIVKPYTSHEVYADHALFLDGKAGVLEAKEKIASAPGEADRLATNAIKSLEKIRSIHLLSPWHSRSPEFIGQAEMIRGRALAARKKSSEAMSVLERGFQRLLIENAIHLSTSEALEAYSEACLKKRTKLCEAWVQRLANQFSKNTLESRVLAKSFKEIVSQAKPNFANSKVTIGYRQKDSDELAFETSMQYVLDQKWSAAVKSFRNFLDEYPRSTHRFRARYWLARAVEEDDDLDEARPIYESVAKDSPLTLHGLLSQWKLGQDPLTRYTSAAPTLQESDVFQTPQEVIRVDRARELIAAGAHELAAMDLRDLKPRDTASGSYLLYLSGLSSLSGAYLASFITLTELITRADELVYNGDTLDIVFPIVDEALVRKGAGLSELDPLLVLSLMKQESGFEKGIHSHVGASGYMQLMPFTASDVEADVKREDLLDPEINIRIGSKYLRRMLNKYQGNIALALAAYNAGPGTVDRWVREGRADRGFLEFVEQIPYKETREYVGTIFRNYVYYQRKLAGKTVTGTEVFWPEGWKPKK